MTDSWRFGWYVEMDPSLKRSAYSMATSPLVDFIGHLNSHLRGEGFAFDSSYLLRSCQFCRILQGDHKNQCECGMDHNGHVKTNNSCYGCLECHGKADMPVREELCS